jgi:hypothetical protein
MLLPVVPVGEIPPSPRSDDVLREFATLENSDDEDDNNNNCDSQQGEENLG